MKKKILKVIAVLVLLFVGLLIAIPFLLEAKIGDIIKNNVNNSIDGKFDFAKADLSLISSFPNAHLSIEDMYLINAAPFEGDTLLAAREVALTMGIGELFKGENDPIGIKNLIIEGASLSLKSDEDENTNYDIAKTDEDNSDSGQQSDGFNFAMESYEIKNSNITYLDKLSAIKLDILDIQHQGTGDLSLSTSELNTTTTALVSFEMDSSSYLSRNSINLDALIGVDLNENKYTFLKNQALINQLPLVFDGYVKLNGENQEVAISFKTPSSDFKNFLAVIPQEYSKNIEAVSTTGEFRVEGNLNGIVDEEHIPEFSITINSENASFKYPDLPKAVEEITINLDINNATGIPEDTYVDLRKASFKIDKDHFNLRSRITELLGNTKVSAHIDGNMDLANISRAYPMPAGLDLKGRLTADITSEFDMASVENKKYKNTRTTGNMDVRGFEYNSADFANPVKIDMLAMNFDPGTVNLTEMKGMTGKTDFNIKGKINNLLGFLFNDENVKGDFDLKSDTFSLNDFMDEEVAGAADGQSADSNSGTVQERIKIPSFLDVNINASSNRVLYDNLILNDVKGNLKIKDEKAVLSNMSSSIFDGRLTFEGEVSTKSENPLFAMQLGMEGFKIGETFKALELFEVLAPIANILQGKMNSKITLSGMLQNDLTPDLQNISGNVLAEVLATNISQDRAELFSKLGSKLSFLKPDKLNLRGLKTALSFEDGTVKVKPFTINYEDIAIRVDGGHSFDKKMNYTATLDVPAKYLGAEINNLIAKIDEKELENLSIPVVASIGGIYTAPVVDTDLSSGLKQLTGKLVEIQKQKMINQGKVKAGELLGSILSKEDKKGDSISNEKTSDAGLKDVVGGVIAANSKKSDSVKRDTASTEKNVVKEKAKDIIGGLFGKKKKDTATSKKDSIN